MRFRRGVGRISTRTDTAKAQRRLDRRAQELDDREWQLDVQERERAEAAEDAEQSQETFALIAQLNQRRELTEALALVAQKRLLRARERSDG